ncbi:putative metal chaperone YciC [compost metagenome]
MIEATGAANPLEIVDAVTETSLYQQVELRGLITVVDTAHLLELYRSQQGATYRLMQEQIRCASVLILNKTDRVNAEEAEEISGVLRKWNAYAEILPAVRCALDPESLLGGLGGVHLDGGSEDQEASGDAASANEPAVQPAKAHRTHDHVMAYTHYFKNAVNSEAFERFVKELPRDVYRAKGIVTFSDTASRFLFQYAYREADFMKITPQGEVPDVAVFIGEHFSSGELRTQLLQLENRLFNRPSAVKRSL